MTTAHQKSGISPSNLFDGHLNILLSRNCDGYEKNADEVSKSGISKDLFDCVLLFIETVKDGQGTGLLPFTLQSPYNIKRLVLEEWDIKGVHCLGFKISTICCN